MKIITTFIFPLTEFNAKYVTPIVRANEPSCTDEERIFGETIMEELQSVTSRFMLRRTSEILIPYLPNKQDLVVFCRAAPLQERIYKAAVNYLAAKAERAECMGQASGISPLHCITSLRQISSHPALLKTASSTSDEPIDVS